MTDPRHDDLLKGRRESASLIGLDADNLSPADTLRCDLISTLRLVIDDAGASILSGNSTDLGRLITATESLIKLLPGRELPKPAPRADDPNDPRKIMWETYLEMRRRGELVESFLSPQQRLEAARAKVAEIEAELAALAPPPDEPSATPPAPAAPTSANAPVVGANAPVVADNVVPLSRPSPPAPSPSPPAASVPVLGDLVGVVSDPREDSMNYVDGQYVGPGQKWWGPV